MMHLPIRDHPAKSAFIRVPFFLLRVLQVLRGALILREKPAMENHNGKPAGPPPQQIPIGLLFLIAAVVPVAGLFLAIAANAMSFADRGYAWIGPVLMVASFLFGASYIIPFARRANAGESPIAVLGAIFLFIEYPFLALMMVGAHAFRFGIAA